MFLNHFEGNRERYLLFQNFQIHVKMWEHFFFITKSTMALKTIVDLLGLYNDLLRWFVIRSFFKKSQTLKVSTCTYLCFFIYKCEYVNMYMYNVCVSHTNIFYTHCICYLFSYYMLHVANEKKTCKILSTQHTRP